MALVGIAGGLLSCTAPQESIHEVADRVFALAEQQYVVLADSLPDDRAPKTIDEQGRLVTSDMNLWCSGFYPGSLWMIYERTERSSALFRNRTMRAR